MKTMLKIMALATSLVSLSAPAWAETRDTTARHESPVETASGLSRASTAPAAPPAGSVEQSYAAREVGAKDLEKFEGGGAGIYISGGAAAVIIVILVLVILL